MTWCKRIACLCALLLALVSAPLRADVKLPSIFGDNMVLQQGRPIPIWGTADPGEKVTVTLGEEAQATSADSQGNWKLEFAARKQYGPVAFKVSGTSEFKLDNVVVGEVWLASGQSNMEWPVSRAKNAEQEIAASENPRIRHIKIPHVPAATPQSDVPSDGWKVAGPETTGGFTAVGYFFARCLEEELDVPVGIIGTNWGGTRIEPWTPPEGFKRVKALEEIAENLDSYPTKNDRGRINHQSPLALYNGMIAPLVPYALRGAIWYQGESNNGEGMLYHEKMKALIAGWRTVWDYEEMPFYYVQLAPFRYRGARGKPTLLPGIWEAQLKTLNVPHTGMAVTVDIGNTRDIHPRNKQDVGKRLCLWALAKTYGRDDLVYSGPLYKKMKVEGNAVRIFFDHVGSGLVSRDGKPLNWFQIAGPDGQFVDATAEIDGETIVVRAESVKKPTAVRFAWHQEAEPNLSNKEGLPASPFRTDEGPTAN